MNVFPSTEYASGSKGHNQGNYFSVTTCDSPKLIFQAKE